MMTSTTRPGSGRQAREAQRVEAVTDQGGLVVAGASTASGSVLACHDDVLPPDETAAAISVAVRAPSLHNTQPWQFRPRPGGIELLADYGRLLPTVDPDGRELMISCGAALFGLRLGLRKLGRLPSVVLLPDLAQPRLVARASAVGHAAQTRAEADLIAAVPHRHTHRGSFSPGEAPARLLSEMVSDAAAEGCELQIVTDPRVIARLSRLVRAAATQQESNPELTAELGRWVRPLGSDARDGIPARARVAGVPTDDAGPTALDRFPGRNFGMPGTEEDGGVPPSATAVLLTPADSMTDWLRAGQALNRILLRAAARWVFASLQSQPLESPRRRSSVRASLTGRGYPQMLLQFGRANTAPATPRRPQAEMRTAEHLD